MRAQYLAMLIVGLLLSACSTSVIDYNIIKVIDHYESNEKNMQLGQDLLYYNYLPGLAELIEDFNENDVKDVKWEYFIRESDKEVSFRVKLNVTNSKIRNNRESVIQYFEKEVEKNYNYHIENEDLLDRVVDYSKNALSLLDQLKFEEFMSNFNSEIATKYIEKDYLSKLEKNKGAIGVLEYRNVTSKQKYIGKINDDMFDFIIVNFESSYSGNKIGEKLTVALLDKFEIVGVRSQWFK